MWGCHFPTFCSRMFGGLNTYREPRPPGRKGFPQGSEVRPPLGTDTARKFNPPTLRTSDVTVFRVRRRSGVSATWMSIVFHVVGAKKYPTHDIMSQVLFSMAHSSIVCTFGSHVLNLDMWCVPYVAALVLTVCSLDPTRTRDTVASGCISVHLDGRESWCNTIIVTLNLVLNSLLNVQKCGNYTRGVN